jgi:hypothetical protein
MPTLFTPTLLNPAPAIPTPPVPAPAIPAPPAPAVPAQADHAPAIPTAADTGRPLLPVDVAADRIASVDSTMKRVMIQMEPGLLERAKRLARERGVSFPQLVREALTRELALSAEPIRPLSCVGAVSTGGRAREREYGPDAWR